MPNAAIVNFAAGETSPKSRGRFDLPWYAAGARKMLNFIPEITGPARFRPGFKMIRETRGGQVARLIPFQLSSSVGYMLEFTPGKMRAYLNEDLDAKPPFFLPGASIDFDDFADLDFTASPVWTPFTADRVIAFIGRLRVTAFDPGGGVVGGAARTPIEKGTNGTFSFRAEISSDGHIFILSDNLAYTADANGVTSFTGDGYGINRVGAGNYKFVRFDAGVPVDLIDLGITGVGFFDFKIVRLSGSNTYFSVYVNGAHKGTIADATHQSLSELTFFGVLADTVNGGTTEIDNIRTPPHSQLSASVQAIGAITQANPAVGSPSDPGSFINGFEYLPQDMQGMTELNGRQVRVANTTATTFEMVDPTTGVSIDSSNFGAYTDAGWFKFVFEIDTPYFADDLDDLSWAISARDGVMYLAHPKHAPRKLTRVSGDFFLTTFARTNDPFTTVLPVLNPESIQRGEITIVVLSGGTVDENTNYTFAGLTGTTELNGGTFRFKILSGFAVPTVRLVDTTTGADIDSRDFGAHSFGGTVTPDVDHPIAVAFYEGRLGYFGTNQRPNSFFLSRGPDNNGNPRYDDFTGGNNDDDAVFFALAPADGRVDFMSWARASSKNLLLGTFGGPFRVSGGGTDQPITPTSVNVRKFSIFGCEATPPAGSDPVFFVQRGGTTIRAVRFDAVDTDEFTADDVLLNAEHIAYSRIKRIVLQVGRPDILWAVREDGILAGMSIHKGEQVTGWHRQEIGGTDAKVLDAQVLQRLGKDDQLWVVTERTIDGVTRRFVEIMTDPVEFPDLEDFFSGEGNEAADKVRFLSAIFRRQEEYIHMDAARTFNGSNIGFMRGYKNKEVTLAPVAKTGVGITFKASESVFRETDIGRLIIKKPDRDTGLGSGKATITAIPSDTEAFCTITEDFDGPPGPEAFVIAAGDWYLTATEISGLHHLEGETVAVVADGEVISDGLTGTPIVVANGKITLAAPAAVVHVGIPYEGILETHNLEIGGQSGPAQAKPRNIVEMSIRFLNSLGIKFGTQLYNLEPIVHDGDPLRPDRPNPVFSGIKKLPHEDSWSIEGEDGDGGEGAEKRVVLAQRTPLPAVVQFVDIRYETGDTG